MDRKLFQQQPSVLSVYSHWDLSWDLRKTDEKFLGEGREGKKIVNRFDRLSYRSNYSLLPLSTKSQVKPVKHASELTVSF